MKHGYILALILCLISRLLCDITINGIVKDYNTKKSIVDANIELLNTELGAISDEKGRFFIHTDLKYPVTIRVSHIAYEPKKIRITSTKEIIIYLVPTVIPGEEVEVTGIKSKHTSDVSSSVDIVDIGSVEMLGARDVGSAIRRVSSVKMRLSSTGKQTASIRGSNPTDVAVFLDGVRLNDSNTGIADLSAIDLNMLDQIQVIKGGNSLLYGRDALGGVLDLESKDAVRNSIYFTRGEGLSFDDDLDLSLGGTGKIEPFGFGGSYSGKSRAYAGRTLTTSIFQNLFGTAKIPSGRFDTKINKLEKSLKFPAGGITTADGLRMTSFRYRGKILNTEGWDILLGDRLWSLDQDFLTSLNEELRDGSISFQVSKYTRVRTLELMTLLEAENQFFTGDKKYFNINGDLTTKHLAEMERQSYSVAIVSRWITAGDHPNIDFINVEVGGRFNRIGTIRNERFEFPSIPIDNNPIFYKNPKFHDITNISSRRLGLNVEGKGPVFTYSFFVNQGFNKRVPTLSDYFHFAYAYSEEVIVLKLAPEDLSSSEMNLQLKFHDLPPSYFLSTAEVSVGLFKNNYSNKIAYHVVEKRPPVPFNTKVADIRGIETSLQLYFLNKRVKIVFNTTHLDVSNPFVFPNKPSYRFVLAGEVYLNWLVLSYDHESEGEQYYFIPGVGEGLRKPRKNANLNVSLRKKIFNVNWTLSYTWRNILSKEEKDLSLEESIRLGFNYFEKYREIITLKVEI